MVIHSIHEAKAHFSAVLEQACAGEEVVIAKHGKPIARLIPIPPQERHAGDFRGRIRGDILIGVGNDDAPWG